MDLFYDNAYEMQYKQSKIINHMYCDPKYYNIGKTCIRIETNINNILFVLFVRT